MTARVFFVISAIATIALAKTLPEESKLVSQFEEFIKEYDKNYADEIEKAMRFGIFVKNLDYIDHLNKHSDPATFGITKFSDLTKEEFLRGYAGYIPLGDDGSCQSVTDVGNSTTAAEFDWRKRGVVSRVKNQGQCLSCYAFSAIGNFEGVYAIKSGRLIEFSEQQIVDCDKKNNGCNRGLMTLALSYLKDQGAMSGRDYPYTAVDGACKYDKSKVIVRPRDCYVLRVSEDAYAQKLQTMGPLAIAVDSDPLSRYNGDILRGNDCAGSRVNHAVLLVGFGEERGIKYWIIKNSYGENWGENGYFRMQRGVNCLQITQQPPISAVM